MKINIQCSDLIKPLNHVAGIVERRQTLPILAFVYVKLDDGRLTLTGTDLEVEVITGINVEGSSSGEMTLPARKLLGICRALPADATVEIKQQGDKATVQSGKSRFTLATMPPGDFPGIETQEWEISFELSQKDFKSLLGSTQFCMAQQDVRYYLNGLLIELDGKKLRAVATDGHRMALRELDLPKVEGKERQAIVPRKGVLEMARFLDESDQPVTISLGTNHVRIELNDLTFTSKLIDGRFPDYDKVVPASQNKKLLVDREELRAALSRAAILSNEKYRGVRLAAANGTLSIMTHNPEQEEAQEELSVEYEGEEIEIGFNINYIIEVLNTLTSKKVEIGMSDSSSSCTLVTPGDENTLYVIMPMRL